MECNSGVEFAPLNIYKHQRRLVKSIYSHAWCICALHLLIKLIDRSQSVLERIPVHGPTGPFGDVFYNQH